MLLDDDVEDRDPDHRADRVDDDPLEREDRADGFSRGRASLRIGVTTVGPDTMRIAPRTAASSAGRSKINFAARAAPTPVMTTPTVSNRTTGRRVPDGRRSKRSFRPFFEKQERHSKRDHREQRLAEDLVWLDDPQGGARDDAGSQQAAGWRESPWPGRATGRRRQGRRLRRFQSHPLPSFAAFYQPRTSRGPRSRRSGRRRRPRARS